MRGMRLGLDGRIEYSILSPVSLECLQHSNFGSSKRAKHCLFGTLVISWMHKPSSLSFLQGFISPDVLESSFHVMYHCCSCIYSASVCFHLFLIPFTIA